MRESSSQHSISVKKLKTKEIVEEPQPAQLSQMAEVHPGPGTSPMLSPIRENDPAVEVASEQSGLDINIQQAFD